MKNITGVFGHGQYNSLMTAYDELLQFMNIELYSSKLLDEGKQYLKSALAALRNSDLILFYPGSETAVWEELENACKDLRTPVVYLGSEGVYKIKNPVDLETSAKCNTYLSYSGNANFINMFKYLLNIKLGSNFQYKDPEFLPWEGIFHPDTKEAFQSAEDYFTFKPKSAKGVIALVVSRSYWINNDISVEMEIIREIENNGFSALPVYTSLKNDELGAKGMTYALEKFLFGKDGNPVPDALIKLTSFFFDSETRIDNTKKSHSQSILQKLNCPVFKPIISSSMSIEEWQDDNYGTVKDIAWGVALPEMEGVIEPLFIGGIKKTDSIEKRTAKTERIKKLIRRVGMWIKLKRKSNSEKRIVFILNNNPCTGTEASVGGAANLDALESVSRILRSLQNKGYDLEGIPKDGKELASMFMNKKAISEFRWTTVKEIVQKGGYLHLFSKDDYLKYFNALSQKVKNDVTAAWGTPPGEEQDGIPAAMIYENKILITGLSFKNAIVCVQPKRGCAGPRCDGTVCKILHDPRVPPTHQYIAAYKYFEHTYKADVLVHVGTHGNLEFLPGKATGLSDDCYPDICSGNLPCLYLYNSDNPPEGTIAKRRALAVIIDHMQTVLIQGGIYDALETLDNLLAQYDKVSVADKTQTHLLEHQIQQELINCKLDTQIDLTDYHNHFTEIVNEAHKILSLVKNTQIQDGLHIFGHIPDEEEEIEFINSIVRYEGSGKNSVRSALAKLFGLDFNELLANKEGLNARYTRNNGSILYDIDVIVKNVLRNFFADGIVDNKLNILDYKIIDSGQINIINSHKDRILDIRKRLRQSKEIDALVRGMNANYIPAGPAGVITRGRDDVLPTGRNFFTLDPNMIPTRAAYETGKRLADKVIEKFMKDEIRYPENFSMYWMCNDITWADGEGMGQLLYMLGVRPEWQPGGRVYGFEIIPLSELRRPRIDITVKVSGILRDSFENCINLLDDAVQAVSALKEDENQNYVRKHTLQILKGNPEMSFSEASSRIFGAKPGTYISGINLAIYASSWKDSKDFLDLFTYFNGYSYSKNSYGKEAFKQLQSNLSSIDITYNKVISDEHDLLGCCCYFGNHGGMTAAAKELSKKDVKTYYGDTREVTNVEVRTLADELRRVVRTKLLNPKWIEGQKRHGYTGAMNISKRVGRVYGWEASTEEVDDWIFDNITNTFITDEENKKFFMENNPWALEEMSRRLIEAYERKLWQPEKGLIEEIRDAYMEIEGFMEDNMGDSAGEFQGGSIDIINLNELENYKKNIANMKKALV